MKKSILLKKIGNNIKIERLKLNISQEALAELAGIHRTYIGMVERAEKNLTINTLEKIAKALNLNISQLLAGL